MKTDILVRLSYDNVFNQKHTIQSLRKEVDVNDSLYLLSTLNKHEYKLREPSINELKFILEEWLIEENQEIKNKLINAYAKHAEKVSHKESYNFSLKTVILINRISTLRVMEVLCAAHHSSRYDEKIDLSKSRENLLKLYLLISDEIASRQTKVFDEYFNKDPKGINEIYFHLFLGITQPVQYYNSGKSLQPEVYKFLLFEKWFRNNSSYNKLLNAYIERLGLENWYQYFSHVFELCRVATESNIITFENYRVLENLADHLTIDTSHTPGWSEFVYLRKSPLFKLDKERYAVLDFEFLLNKFFSSLYHDILLYSKERGLSKFAQDYVKEFIEGILLKNAFQTSFRQSY